MKLLMSEKERCAAKVMEPYVAGQLSRRRAAELLAVTERHVSRLARGYRAGGDAALVHRGRGRPSNRRLPAKLIERAVALVADQYHGFGPTLAAERLALDHGLSISTETLRRALIDAGLWKPRARTVKHRHWRERKPCFGQLVQMDSSVHDWLEGRGEQAVLLAMIDDATSRACCRFAPADSGQANRALLLEYLQRHGRPIALYTDRASHFVTTREPSVEEELRDALPRTQIGRALEQLGIELILAGSPQAKGRVERFFGTAQDRLVKELRLAGVATIQQANDYLDSTYMPWWNSTRTQPPASSVDAHRDAQDLDLHAALSHQERRQVANDYTIQYRSRRYQILKPSQRPGLARSAVTVQERLDGSVAVWARGQYLQVRELPATSAPACSPVGLRPPCEQAAAGPTAPRTPHRPAPNHPWRTPHRPTRQGTFLSSAERDISIGG